MKKEKKPIYKDGYFWLVVVILLVLVGLIVYKKWEDNKTVKAWQRIGETMNEEREEEDSVKSHLDEFSYNYETGEVEYRPEITLEMYNRIEEGMTQEEVIAILGKEENKLDGENTYLLEWGNSYEPIYGGYWIQIVLEKGTEKVLSMSETGL